VVVVVVEVEGSDEAYGSRKRRRPSKLQCGRSKFSKSLSR
jgi:hypothetical protein